jgi:hypothetical protein
VADGRLSGNVALLNAGQNNFGGALTATSFSGSGSGLTSLNASQLSSGTVADARLSSNVPLLSASQNNFSGALTAGSLSTPSFSAASVSGGGSGLTNLNASQLSSGTVADTRLSSNVPRLNGSQNFSGVNTFSNSANSFAGDGSRLTNLNAAALTGAVSVAQLPTNIALRTGGNVFSGIQQVSDTYAAAPEALDQQQTLDNAGTGSTANWQSFTAGQSGLLTRVALRVSSPLGFSTPSPGTLSIYSGEGTNGTLLASQSVTFAAGLSSFQSFPLNLPPLVQSNSQYTIGFTVPVMTTVWVDTYTGNAYTGGRSDWNSSADYLFKTYVAPSTVGAILSVNSSYSGNVGIGTNAPQARLHVVGDVLATGMITGSGTITGGSITGATVTAGSIYAGTIGGNGSALTNLSATALSGTVADIQLSTNVALRAGGNNFSGAQLVADTYFTGSESLDQQQTIVNAGTGGPTNWQSFTAGLSGFLTRVALQVSSPLGTSSSPGRIDILTGEGTSGAVLASQSVTYAPVASAFQTFTLSAPPMVQSGTQYTIRFSAPVVTLAWVDLSTTNTYSGGRADFGTNADYLFKTYVTPGASGPILSVNPANSGNVGIGTNAPQARLHVAGDVLVTGTFMGNGGGLTSLSAAQLNSGSLPDARLSGTYSSALTLNNAANSISGNGSGLTSLNASQVSSGTLADARLSSNVPLLNAQNTFTNLVSGGGLTLDASSFAGAFNLKSANGIRASFGLATSGGNYSTDATAGDSVLRASAGELLLQAGSGSSAIAIATNNQVGIGKVNPSTILDVNGTVTATGLNVHGTAAANSLNISGTATASTLSATTGVTTPSLTVSGLATAGTLGVGVSIPSTALHVAAGGDCEISVQSADAGAHRWTIQSSGTNTAGLAGTFQIIDRTAGASRLLIDTSGKAGVNANNLFVTGGGDNLRIVRGTVNSDGTIASGSGFTVNHTGTGVYAVTFTTAFTDTPAVTATAITDGVTSLDTLASGSFGCGVHAGSIVGGNRADRQFSFIAVGAR